MLWLTTQLPVCVCPVIKLCLDIIISVQPKGEKERFQLPIKNLLLKVIKKTHKKRQKNTDTRLRVSGYIYSPNGSLPIFMQSKGRVQWCRTFLMRCRHKAVENHVDLLFCMVFYRLLIATLFFKPYTYKLWCH